MLKRRIQAFFTLLSAHAEKLNCIFSDISMHFSFRLFDSGIQHLLINRKFQMITPRAMQSMVVDDKEDVKPKIIEGAYLKLPPDFNVVTSNAISSLNASHATSKHNYSLPPQAAFHQLIGQPQQTQNKVIINPSHLSTNLALATQSMGDKITIPTSNIKLNLVPSLAQVMQSGGGLVIDAKSGTVAGDIGHVSGGLEHTVGATSSTSSPQIHYQHQQKVKFSSIHFRILTFVVESK